MAFFALGGEAGNWGRVACRVGTGGEAPSTLTFDLTGKVGIREDEMEFAMSLGLWGA